MTVFLGSLPPPYGGIASHLRDLSRVRPITVYDCQNKVGMAVNWSWGFFRAWLWILIHYESKRFIYHLAYLALHAPDKISAYHVEPEGVLGYLYKRFIDPKCKLIITVFGELHTSSKPYFKEVLDSADLLMASSKYCASGVVKHGVEKPVTVIPYGVDIQHFQPAKKQGKYILFVGHIHERMGLDTLLKAAYDLPVVVAGTDMGYLKTLQANLPSKWRIVLNPSYENLPKLYQGAMMLVHPANTAAPCMGLSLKEAMACGIPVIASDAGGIPEAIRNGLEGLVFKVNDSDELRERIRELVADPRARDYMGMDAHDRAERLYDRDKTSVSVLEAIDNV